MKIKTNTLLALLSITGILIFSFAAGCISKEVSDDKLQTDENILSGNETGNISQENNSANTTNGKETTENISSAGTAVQTNCENQYTPLWKAGIIASDTDSKSYCLITKYLPETSEYYIQNVLYPPQGSPYISKDSSIGGMGTKYPSESIDKKYCVFVQKTVKIPVYAKGSTITVAGYLERDTQESMKMNWTLE